MSPRRIPLSALLVILAATAAAEPALAEAAASKSGASEPGDRLEAVERAMARDRARKAQLERAARTLARDLAALRTDLVKAARATQAQEAELSRLERELAALTEREATMRRALDRRRAELGRTLAALERLALYPPAAVIAVPASARDTIRSALLLRTVIPYIEARAAALNGELAELVLLRADITRQRRKMKEAAAALEVDRAALARLVARKAALQRRTDAERRRVAARLKALATRARTLRDLIAGLEADRPRPESSRASPDAASQPVRLVPPEGLRRFSEGRGQITLPVRGRVIRAFDAEAHTGTYNKGLLIESRAGAQVVAPYDGRVVFAGPFRGYGQILIIEHGGGYHTLLAGLRRIDGAVNQWLLAGEPVGIMGNSGTEPPTLYLEIRYKGRPINPLPWLAIDQAKVNG